MGIDNSAFYSTPFKLGGQLCREETEQGLLARVQGPQEGLDEARD